MRLHHARSTGDRTVLALAAAATAACLLGLAAAPAAGVTPATATAAPPSASPTGPPVRQVTDEDARAGAVVAIVEDVEGRPAFVEVPAPTLAQALRRAAALPGADGVAVDTPVTALGTVDPLRAKQWSLDALGVDRLPAPVGRASHLVAVVDTGVRATHEDFAAGQVRCDLGTDLTGERPGGNGCYDPQGHGTHVAGIVGAVAGNGLGVGSVAPGTGLLPVRVLDSRGAGSSVAVARGIVHATDAGAAVINLSLGGTDSSSALDAAVQYATEQGALVVAAAGNNRTTGNQANYPAASPGALSVASTDVGGISSSFSHRGPTVDVAAPGGGIPSTWSSSNTAYSTLSGTSMAAPAVSAVASLYRAAHPTATPAQVTAALVRTAIDLEAVGRDDATGAGLVDPPALLGTSSTAPPSTVPVPQVRLASASVPLGAALSVSVSDFRPGSTVSVLETYAVVQRVPVRGTARSAYLPTWTLRRTPTTVLLGTAVVGADGRRAMSVLPVQRAGEATLVVRGVDRGARVVQPRTTVQVG